MRDEQYLPSIISNIDGDPNTFSHLAFKCTHRAEYYIPQNYGKLLVSGFVEWPIESVPKQMADYTRSLIVKLFLSYPGQFGSAIESFIITKVEANDLGHTDIANLLKQNGAKE